jgi:2,3-diketo-5-methylthio-1-phosphopentane phosphatase
LKAPPAISFVHNVLFPYARERLAAFVTAQQYAEPVKTILDNLRAEIDNPAASTAELIDTLLAFMDEDRKSTALKALQGIIWREGYGDFTGHLYPDVLPALEKWKSQGIDFMYIPLAPSRRRNCYLATATKVILLICSGLFRYPGRRQARNAVLPQYC